jgi:hypothetical protein
MGSAFFGALTLGTAVADLFGPSNHPVLGEAAIPSGLATHFVVEMETGSEASLLAVGVTGIPSVPSVPADREAFRVVAEEEVSPCVEAVVAVAVAGGSSDTSRPRCTDCP